RRAGARFLAEHLARDRGEWIEVDERRLEIAVDAGVGPGLEDLPRASVAHEAPFDAEPIRLDVALDEPALADDHGPVEADRAVDDALDAQDATPSDLPHHAQPFSDDPVLRHLNAAFRVVR